MFEKITINENEYIRINHEKLYNFFVDIFKALNVDTEHAKIVAENLITAELRGIETHGAQRLKRYVDGIMKNTVNINPDIKILKNCRNHALIDGDDGLGCVVGDTAMKLAIKKAKENDFGFVGVRNSTHYGIAGYYVLLASIEDLIGISMTNTRALVAPTHGIKKTIGTNPIAIAVPIADREPFLLDMATSVVSTGRFEMYKRYNKPILKGWGIDKYGNLAISADAVLTDGAELPLGGIGEEFGGHKGYGLSLVIDIFCGLLTGGVWCKYVRYTNEKHSNVCHFFGALNIDAFTDKNKFKQNMKKMMTEIKSSEPYKNEKIWIPGEKGFLTTKTRKKIGIPIYKKVFEEINNIAIDVGVQQLKP